MADSIRKKSRFNLFHGVLLVSLAIHLAILLHVSGLVSFGALTYIEVGMKENSRPVGREMPRPRVRHTAPTIATTQETRVQKMVLPPVKIDPVDASRPDTLMEGIGVPQLPGVPSPTRFSSADWGLSKPSNFFTKRDYFDMLRLKIETCKRYPDAARARHMEGKVKISFVITAQGQVLSATIVKPSRHKSLDRAALRALEQAAPFAPPPASLFAPPLAMEITIVFELT
jgi:protein TonB